MKCKDIYWVYCEFRYYELFIIDKNVFYLESEREGGRINGFKWIKFDIV